MTQIKVLKYPVSLYAAIFCKITGSRIMTKEEVECLEKFAESTGITYSKFLFYNAIADLKNKQPIEQIRHVLKLKLKKHFKKVSAPKSIMAVTDVIAEGLLITALAKYGIGKNTFVLQTTDFKVKIGTRE
jgi:signal recognition particle receptor subunit beta